VEHRHEAHAPGVALTPPAPLSQGFGRGGRVFIDQHRHVLVDSLRQVGILPGTEDGQGAGVGVDAGNVGGAQVEDAARVAQVIGAGGEK
jgi:hypothetical protein